MFAGSNFCMSAGWYFNTIEITWFTVDNWSTLKNAHTLQFQYFKRRNTANIKVAYTYYFLSDI